MSIDLTPLVYHLRRLAPHDPGADAELLARFAHGRDDTAFAELVARHGPMVWRVCRRILCDHHATEDSFQATFLVLARRVGAIRQPGRLTGWLYGVALRVARKARSAGWRQPAAGVTDPPAPGPDPLADMTARELVTVLDEEVERLPETYRLPVLLCALEGLSQEEAAQRLGWTPGSVKGRLERGRRRLHERLVRRGLTLTAALATAQAAQVTAAVPVAPAAATGRAAMAVATGQGTAGIPAGALLLAQGAGGAAPRWKVALVLLLAVVQVGGLGWLLARGSVADLPPRQKAPAAKGLAVPANQGQPPEQLPAAVVAAWEKAGSNFGWMDLNYFDYFAEKKIGNREGQVPAFWFDGWEPGAIKKLPQPRRGFGLVLRSAKVSDRALRELAGLKFLQALDLNGAHVTDAGMKELAGLKSLRMLNLGGTTVSDRGLKELTGLQGLRTLSFRYSPKITDAGLKDLAKLKSLRKLDLSGSEVTDAGLKELAALADLEELLLDSTQLSGVGLKKLAGLKSLRSLFLVGARVTDAGVKCLAELKGLETLQLDGTDVTDAGIKELAGLKELRVLTLGDTKVTGSGLKGLTGLEYLILKETPITDAGLKELAGLKRLQTLSLVKTRVTDRGLSELAGLTELMWLDVRATGVTAAGAAELKKKLPKLDITGVGEP